MEISTSMPRLSLSVVIGARADDDPRECLDAVFAQVDDGVEVILVSAAPREEVRRPRLQQVVREGGLVPELWAAGIERSSGRLIGLLASSSIPDDGWVTSVRQAHAQADAVIVGGAIEPGPRFRLVDWAVYFCRYSPYMRPMSSADELEVPGDNASYDGDVLREYDASYEHGFWEPFVHAALRADGHKQTFCEQRSVHVAAGVSAQAFCRQRFAHGQAHGRSRSEGVPRWRIAAGVATSPLVPLVMTVRAARIVVAKRRHIGRFAMAVPLVGWFYACWAAGEALGRVHALRGRRET